MDGIASVPLTPRMVFPFKMFAARQSSTPDSETVPPEVYPAGIVTVPALVEIVPLVEPLFAMEDRQKESALAYLRDFVHATGTTVYIAMHELDLSKKYPDMVLLFYPNRDMALGTPAEVLTDAELEKAYGIPAALLKKKEDMTREQLQSEAALMAKSAGK